MPGELRTKESDRILCCRTVRALGESLKEYTGRLIRSGGGRLARFISTWGLLWNTVCEHIVVKVCSMALTLLQADYRVPCC